MTHFIVQMVFFAVLIAAGVLYATLPPVTATQLFLDLLAVSLLVACLFLLISIRRRLKGPD